MKTWIQVCINLIVSFISSYMLGKTKEKLRYAENELTLKDAQLEIGARPSMDRDALLERMPSGV